MGQVNNGIAIVGLAMRFPGGCTNESAFWGALNSQRDLVTHVPANRWATSELQHPDRSEPGRSITFAAGTIGDINGFDAAFFGISPREAAWLDPQQRLLLELSWEAMENAGVAPARLAGSNCAVYVGISALDYGTRGLDDLASLSSYSMTGNTLSIAANRLSYFFDLRGPSMAVDTACSSSLVALHQACQTLRTGDADTALVGGVSLLLHPYPFVGFTKASMLSATGRCRPFDAAADGYVRAEGGAVVMLKPYRQAVADGDTIHAVILASHVNADGARKSGITIPSVQGQVELMQSALAASGLHAHDVDYIEAHGTGTPVGDPIEAHAIGTVYGQGREAPLPIGSVKSNLGHMEAASGMGGLLKTVLALKHGVVPGTLHLRQPNPNIDFRALNVCVPTQTTPLAASANRPRVAGVNSFGFGGANAHVLLCAPEVVRIPPSNSTSLNVAGVETRGSKAPSASDTATVTLPPLYLSAHCEPALRELAGRYADLIATLEGAKATQSAAPHSANATNSPATSANTPVSDTTAPTFYDVAYAAVHQRQPLGKRLALQATSIAQAVNQLRQFASGNPANHVVREDALAQPGDVAFVYSGNGAQWQGMARQLLAESATFSATLAMLDALMQPHAGFSVLQQLQATDTASQLDDTTVAQPLLFAIQVGITEWLRKKGIRPAAVTGHSVGEIAAAWASGALSLDQAIKVICARSRAQGLTRGQGRMAAATITEAEFAQAMDALGGAPDITIAGYNSPANLTLTGNEADLQRLGSYLKQQGVFFRLLPLDYAFHSRYMDPIRQQLLESLQDLASGAPHAARFVSAVSGTEITDACLNADYWWRNIREPVRFADAIECMAQLGCRVFVEIGPNAILQRYITETLAQGDTPLRVLPTLQRHRSGQAALTDTALRTRLLAGPSKLDVDFPVTGHPVSLPNYPWQREPHWHPQTSESLHAITNRRVHPLLGWRVSDAELIWENILDTAVLPWLAHHQVGGAVVFPAAGFAEMALAASREWRGGQAFDLESLDILAPLVIDDQQARTVRVVINPRDGSVHIKSRQRLSDDDFTLHAAGRLLEFSGVMPQAQLDTPGQNATPISTDTHYQLAAGLGLQYGPAFQGLQGIVVDGDTISAEIALPDAVNADGYLLHPAALDVCFQALVCVFHDAIKQGQGTALLPVRIGRLTLLGDGRPASLRANLTRRSARSVLASFELFDAHGKLLAVLHGCRFQAAMLNAGDKDAVSHWAITPWLQPHPATAQHAAVPGVTLLIDAATHALQGQEAERAPWFTDALPLSEILVLAFAYEAAQTLAATTPDLTSVFSGPDASPLAKWLGGVLQHEGLLIKQGGRLQPAAAAEADLPPAAALWQDLLRRYPAYLSTLTLLGRWGLQLPDVLTGQTCPLQLKQALLTAPAADTLYQHDPTHYGVRQALEAVLQRSVAQLPSGRRLRVLEIAPGPSLLAGVLPNNLSADCFHYTLLINKVLDGTPHTNGVANHPSVTVSYFDPTAPQPLSSPQAENGPMLYDLIIVRNSLNGMADARAALEQARTQLAMGGVLVVAERYPDWSAHVIDGLDPDWWIGAGDALDPTAHAPQRADSIDDDDGTVNGLSPQQAMPVAPLQSPQAWQAMLDDCGFSQTTVWTEPASDALHEGVYLLLAQSGKANALDPVGLNNESSADTALTPATPQKQPVHHPHWLLLCDAASAPFAQQLQHALQASGHASVSTTMLLQPAGSDPITLPANGPQARADTADDVVFMCGWAESPADVAAPSSATAALMRLAQQRMAANTDGRLWVVSRGGAPLNGFANHTAALETLTPNPAQAALWGFGRVLMNEAPALGTTLIDLGTNGNLLNGDHKGPVKHNGQKQNAPGVSDDDDQNVAPSLSCHDDQNVAPGLSHDDVQRLVLELTQPDALNEIITVPQGRYTLVMHGLNPADATAMPTGGRQRLDFHTPGKLRNLTWMPAPEAPLGDNDVEVRTRATGLNFRDVMYVLGLLPDEAVEDGFAGASLGLEFSGVVLRTGAGVRDLKPGDAVMGFGSACFSSHVVTQADALAPLPEGWSFEAGATVPTVFFTVYYALKHLANLQPGQQVLIHGAAGGVGLAAINLARVLGAQIFATAGTPEKRDVVRLLGAHHVFDSRSLAFADQIMALTDGKGVDVVLNSLAGEAMQRSLTVLKPFGRFLELGKRDFFENTPVGLRPMRHNISYFGIDADQLLVARPDLAAQLFREVMALFKDGALHPLPYRAFLADQVEDAFNTMRHARHIGKIVVTQGDDATATETETAEAARTTLPTSEGAAEIGISMSAPAAVVSAPHASEQAAKVANPLHDAAQPFTTSGSWLVTGGISGFGLETARWLARHGAQRLILAGRRGPDTPGADAIEQEFAAQGIAVEIKACDVADADAVQQLIADTAHHTLPLIGVVHAAAVFDDRLVSQVDAHSLQRVLDAKLRGAWCLHQATHGIQLQYFIVYSSVTTAIGNPGQANYVAANAGLESLVARRRQQGLPATCMAWGPIDDAGYLAREQDVKNSLEQRLGRPPLKAEHALDQLGFMLQHGRSHSIAANFDWNVLARLLPSGHAPRFGVLNRNRQTLPGDAGDIQQLLQGRSPQEATQIVQKLVATEVAQTLAIPVDRIGTHDSLYDLGMDSLMATELALGLEQRFGVQLPAMMLNDAPTVSGVAARILARLDTANTAATTAPEADLLTHLGAQHGTHFDDNDLAALRADTKVLEQRGATLIE